MFEGLLVDNYRFISMNEAIHFVNIILKEFKEVYNEKLDNYIKRVDAIDLIDRLMLKFFVDDIKPTWRTMITNCVMGLTEDQRTFVYYKYNLLQFIRDHENIMAMYRNIYKHVVNYQYADKLDDIPKSLPEGFTGKLVGDEGKDVKEWNSFVNKQYFIDPNSPPDTIKEDLKGINKELMKYVYFSFMSFDRIWRLKYFLRKTVVIVDTDSNIMAIDKWVNFCKYEVLDGKDYDRTYEFNKFISVNTLTYFITEAVGKTLWDYGASANIPDEFKTRFSMKNELIGSCKITLIAGTNLDKVNQQPIIRFNDYRKAVA